LVSLEPKHESDTSIPVKGARVGLAIVGVLAVLATAAFVGITFFDLGKPGSGRSPSARPAPSQPADNSPVAAEETLAPDPLASFPHPGESMVADAAVAKVAVYDAPNGKTTKTLNNPTIENVPLVLGVTETQGDWLRVQLPVRPNGSTGWVKKSEVKTRSVQNHIVVEIAKRRLTAWQGSELLMESPVGVGTDKTPTPPGTYYVDVSARNPGHGMGVHMLSISGFSEVLKNFGGGLGQLAIHGTSNMATVGTNASNGCLRLPNDTVAKLAKIAPTGTPVFVLP